MHVRLVAFVLAQALWGLAGFGVQLTAAELRFDGMVDEAGRQLLVGKPAAIQLLSGNVIGDAEVLGFITDHRTQGVRFFQYKDGSRKVRLKTSDIYRLVIDGKWYAFRYHRPSGGLYLIDRDKAKEDAEARIAGKDRELREPQTAEEVSEAVADQIDIFNDGRKAIAPAPLNFAESDFCLLLTDFPESAAKQVAAQVDVMCEQMNSVFGLPKGANIWQGKMMVTVFSRRDRFASFQSKVMNNNNYGTSTTIYYTNRRRFLVSTYRKELNTSLLSTISWSMAGGYIGRYRSNVGLPAWVQAGLQGSLHRKMFPKPSTEASVRKKVAGQLKRTGGLLGILSATELNEDRRSLAKLLVNHLIDADPQAFSQFFEDLKLGHSWTDALNMNYGATPEMFAADFGRKMGVPNLIP